MNITVRYFAAIREALGVSAELVVATDAPTLAALRDELIARGGAYAALARDKAVRMALDQVMSDETATLADGAEVAFFPPVTGG
jgi:molybdopterin synthase sulfur carrier subunit